MIAEPPRILLILSRRPTTRNRVVTNQQAHHRGADFNPSAIARTQPDIPEANSLLGSSCDVFTGAVHGIRLKASIGISRSSSISVEMLRCARSNRPPCLRGSSFSIWSVIVHAYNPSSHCTAKKLKTGRPAHKCTSCALRVFPPRIFQSRGPPACTFGGPDNSYGHEVDAGRKEG